MFQRSLSACALALALVLPSIPASAQADRRAAAEAYARVIDYPLLIEKAATRRAADLPALERAAFIDFITREVDFEMIRFYATSAMVDLFEAGELQALVSFAATPRPLGTGQAACAWRRPHPDRRTTDQRRRAQLPRALSEPPPAAISLWRGLWRERSGGRLMDSILKVMNRPPLMQRPREDRPGNV